MFLRVQPARIAEAGVRHPQLRGAGVHLLHEDRFAAAHQFGHGHRRVVRRRNADGPQHLVQRKLLPRFEPDLAAAHVVRMFADRHKGVEGEFSTMDGLKGEKQSHQLGDGRDGHPLVGVLFVEHPPALRLHQHRRPAGQGKAFRSRRRLLHRRSADEGRFVGFPRCYLHPQPRALRRPEGQRKQPEAEHPRTEQGQISPFHSSYLPA